jgi:hypothetical protein
MCAIHGVVNTAKTFDFFLQFAFVVAKLTLLLGLLHLFHYWHAP